MNPLFKNILLLSVFGFLFFNAGFLTIKGYGSDLPVSDVAILSGSFTLIGFVTLIIFFRGQKKEPDSQTMHTLVSLSLKFLIELMLAVIWFLIAKKTGISSVILFFVLYLAFTLVLVTIMLKTLKNKSL